MKHRNQIIEGGRNRAGAVVSRSAAARRAFTLIELLTVIAIIAALAGLLIPLSSLASTKMRVARVSVELNKYVTAIESYKARLNYYPPDNRQVATSSDPDLYRQAAAKNPLFYELSGTVYTNKGRGRQYFQTLNGSETITPTDLKTAFGLDGIQNSARDPRDVPYKGINLKAQDYAALSGPGDIQLLVLPVKGPNPLQGVVKGGTATVPINPFRYDSSSTNRHNREGFDLWAEYIVGKKTNIVGNWKD